MPPPLKILGLKMYIEKGQALLCSGKRAGHAAMISPPRACVRAASPRSRKMEAASKGGRGGGGCISGHFDTDHLPKCGDV